MLLVEVNHNLAVGRAAERVAAGLEGRTDAVIVVELAIYNSMDSVTGVVEGLGAGG